MKIISWNVNGIRAVLKKGFLDFINDFNPDIILAADASSGPTSLNMIFSPVGVFCILIFIIAYGFVMAEEFTHFRKSKPVILAATIIWVVIAYVASQDPSISPKWAETQFRHVVLEFAELFFFLFVAMAYVNSLTERRMFDALCSWLSNNKFSYKKIFWVTGVIAFFLSPNSGALTATIGNIPLILLTTIVDNASPSISSAITNRDLFC